MKWRRTRKGRGERTVLTRLFFERFQASQQTFHARPGGALGALGTRSGSPGRHELRLTVPRAREIKYEHSAPSTPIGEPTAGSIFLGTPCLVPPPHAPHAPCLECSSRRDDGGEPNLETSGHVGQRFAVPPSIGEERFGRGGRRASQSPEACS